MGIAPLTETNFYLEYRKEKYEYVKCRGWREKRLLPFERKEKKEGSFSRTACRHLLAAQDMRISSPQQELFPPLMALLAPHNICHQQVGERSK